MQELFDDKLHFFKFHSVSDKPRLQQLKVITSSHSTVQASLTAWMFSSPRGNPSRKGKYPMLRTNTKPHQLIKHAKISYSIASLAFRKFSYRTYQNGLSQVPQTWGTPSISKKMNRVSSIHFVKNPHFSVLLHRMRYLENLFMSRKNRLSFSCVSLKSETKDACS